MAHPSNRTWWSRWPTVVAAVVAIAVLVGYVGVRMLHPGRPGTAGCPGGSRAVSMGVDPSALSWVTDLARTYNGEHRQVSGMCAQLSVAPLPLELALQALQATPHPDGGPPPEIWLPTSTTNVELLRDRPSSRSVVPAAVTSIASSPLVVTAPADALAAIKPSPGAVLRFSDYLNLARDPRGWGRVGHPGWGPVRFSSADPHGTETGVSLIQAVATTSAGVPLDQTTARTFSDPAALAGLLSFVHVLARTSNDPIQLFDAAGNMSSGAAIIKAFGLIVATEQQVYEYNQGGAGVPLKAAYPFGGTYAANYPVVALGGTWVDDFARSAAADFAAWTRTPAARARLAGYGLRGPDGSLGRMDAASFGPDTARLTPKPAAPEAVSTARGLWNLFNRPASVLAVCDTSASMAKSVPGTGRSRLDLVRRAMSGALESLKLQDHLGLWEFSTRLDGNRDYREVVPLGVMADRVKGKTREQALQDGFATLRPHTATGLYDTTLAAYLAAQRNYLQGAFNTVVLLTDGQNEDDEGLSLDGLLAQLARHRDPNRPVHLIILAIGDQTDPATLGRISKAADGASFTSPDLSDIVPLFLTAQVNLANT